MRTVPRAFLLLPVRCSELQRIKASCCRARVLIDLGSRPALGHTLAARAATSEE